MRARKTLVFALVTAALAILIGGCTPFNLEETKAGACAKWREAGYRCVGYEGYQFGLWFGGRYGGAKVWHTLKRDEAPTTIYTGFVQMWGDELHVYGPTAVDAIKGQN